MFARITCSLRAINLKYSRPAEAAEWKTDKIRCQHYPPIVYVPKLIKKKSPDPADSTMEM